MAYVIQPRAVRCAAVAGSSDQFPVARIYCVGRNYAEHTKEMGGDPTREAPFFFIKDADGVVPDGATIAYPPLTKNFHYELELVVAIGKEGYQVPAAKAKHIIWGYGVGLDMTRRDLQNDAKKTGRPWCLGKNFPEAAPLAALHPASKIGHPASGNIELKVNGVTKQKADLKDLIWNVGEIVEHLSAAYRLRPGDLIYTGTPAGVGPVVTGDVMEGVIEGVGKITIKVGPAGAA